MPAVDPAGPSAASVGFAWSGPAATLDDQPSGDHYGVLDVTESGDLALRVDGSLVDTAAVEETACGGRDVLCLNYDRFTVEVDRRTTTGAGRRMVVPAGSADSRLLWFFSEDNWEMLVKVVDGCAVNGSFWVFAAATTDVGFSLTVTDPRPGAITMLPATRRGGNDSHGRQRVLGARAQQVEKHCRIKALGAAPCSQASIGLSRSAMRASGSSTSSYVPAAMSRLSRDQPAPLCRRMADSRPLL